MGAKTGRFAPGIRTPLLCLCLLSAGCGASRDETAREAAATAGSAHPIDFSREKNHHSQNGEELLIREFFQDRREGFFVDVGCAWPVAYSNTYYLESRLGWRGIGIDALPEHARRWRNRRPRSRFFNYIVTDRSGGPVTFYRTVDPDLRGISSVEPRLDPAGGTVDYEEIRIPTITLTELLDSEGVERIDFLNMDIEGGEPAALAGFDIERFRPQLACIEAHAEGRKAILDYFTAHAYALIEDYLTRDPVNYYFTPAPGSD